MLSAEVQARITDAMSALSQMERAAFVLRHFEGQSIDEISRALGLKTNATKHSIFRAVKKMRHALEPLVAARISRTSPRARVTVPFRQPGPMATHHLTEDELILHYYGETAADEEQRASAHLEACGSAAANTRGCSGCSGSSTNAPSRWSRRRRSSGRSGRGSSRTCGRRGAAGCRGCCSPAPLGLAAAVVVLVVGAFFAGRALSPAPSPSQAAAAAVMEQIRERILLADLGEHLDRSQMVLVELVSADDDATGDISGERSRAEQLVADSRLYRQTAEDTGDVQLSELLDEIERVLTEVAASPQTGRRAISPTCGAASNRATCCSRCASSRRKFVNGRKFRTSGRRGPVPDR